MKITSNEKSYRQTSRKWKVMGRQGESESDEQPGVNPEMPHIFSSPCPEGFCHLYHYDQHHRHHCDHDQEASHTINKGNPIEIAIIINYQDHRHHRDHLQEAKASTHNKSNPLQQNTKRQISDFRPNKYGTNLG